MKTLKNKYLNCSLLALMLLVAGCSERDLNDLQQATQYKTTPEVFIDGFPGDLQYAAFGGSDVKAFDVDKEVKYAGIASMKIAVPAVNDPNGAYAGGVYFSTTGRDLSGYNCMTFWAKATKSASIDLIGFGNDLGANKYQVSLSGVAVNTNWKKFYIPIPDPSKLKMEKGMFFYSEGPENEEGYTFWIDEVKFENLGTIAHPQPQILGGVDKTTSAFNNIKITIDGLSETFNLPNGINQTVNVSPAFFEFNSSDPAVATVSETGVVSVIGGGNTVITAKMGDVDAVGSLNISSGGDFIHAPTPTLEASRVISLFSDAYTNVPVDYFNGYWQPYQTTKSADFEVNGDHVLNYTNFNFVGNGFSNPTVNASAMSHIHFDLFVPKGITGGQIKITVRDFGADGADGGNDDTNQTQTFTSLTTNAWNSLNIPIKSMAKRTKIGLIVYEIVGTSLTNFYLDNIYFYNDGSIIPAVPTVAAPNPTQPAANVLSIFSDAYTNVAGTDLNPGWGQATVVTQPTVAGNKTLLYTGLNYQGIQLGSSLNVSGKTYLHLDYYTANSSTLNVYLISTGPKEKGFALTVPSSANWTSVNIPLTTFSGVVNLSDVIQLKFDGNGNIYLDNIYFY